ncbi:MAG: HAMP domain-containing histidine kinase [Bacteroidales bacterium]|jgi:two-component system phosphate regulon sensor histidine kinase PhoR|nr:HAMP domain-containing histidine kinase [Bacteroidales bacterium]
MKLRTIIILILAMVLSFVALIIIQVRYVKENSEMIENQFDASVRRSLWQTVFLVEENEALEYLGQTLELLDYQNNPDLRQDSRLSDIDTLSRARTLEGRKFIRPRIRISTKHGKATIEETSKYLQDKFRKEFSRSKTILDQAVFRWLRESSHKDIRERVDFEELNYILEKYLTSNGIDLPFYYCVVDKSGREIFSCKKDIDYDKQEKSSSVYRQKFFPLEDSAKEVYLQVTFPTKKNYIINSMSLLYPSIILILLILGIFIVAVIVIFKQKQLNSIKTDFVNNMTHELKTPIASISLASQMLQDPGVGKTPETLKHISKVVKEETSRLSRMVEEVLKLSLFETEKSTYNMKEMHVNELIAYTSEIFSLKVNSKGGKITTILKAKDDLILADEVHFTNVIHSIVDNALKYSDKPLLLTLETWNEKDNLLISFEDNGIGMSKEDLKRIFDKFYRVSTGNKHDVKGFGLGLAYVKKIIQEHRGTIKVDSELNIGTKFTITLPTLKKH